MIKRIVHLLNRIKPPRWALHVEKRFRFVLSTCILTGLMLITTLFPDMALFQKALIFLPMYVVLIYGLTFFSILEGVENAEWYMLFVIPLFLTIALFFFYNLIPIRWLTRIPFIMVYAVGIYAVLLISNIFNVGAEKNLQLYRAAFSLNYFFQTVIMFLLFNTLLSLAENFVINAVGAAVLTFILSLQFFWSIKLESHVTRDLIMRTVLLSLLVGQSALILSFLPLPQTVFALVLTAVYYSIAGLIYAHLDQRLFKETIREYILVLAVVLVVGALSIKW